MLYFILGLLTGFLVLGIAIIIKARTRQYDGTLIVNTSDPDGAYLFLEMNGNRIDIPKLLKSKEVRFQVRTDI